MESRGVFCFVVAFFVILVFQTGFASAINYDFDMYFDMTNHSAILSYQISDSAFAGRDGYDLEFYSGFLPENIAQFYSNVSGYRFIVDAWSALTNPRTLNLVYDNGGATGNFDLVWNFSTPYFGATLKDFGSDNTYSTQVGSSIDMESTSNYSSTITDGSGGKRYFQIVVTNETSASESSGSSGSSGGGGGGGGGGGAGANASTNVVKSSQTIFEEEVNVGEKVTGKTVITNSKSRKVTYRISVDDSLKEIISVPSSLEVPAFDSADLIITINGVNVGIYEGSIYLTGETDVQKIPVKIFVRSRSGKLLDVNLNINTKNAVSGKSISVVVDLSNLGQEGKYDVSLDYYIFDVLTNSSVLHEEETREIDGSVSISHEIKLPDGLPEGNYNLIVEATYGDAVSTSLAPFFVKRKPSYLVPILLGVGVIVAAGLIYYLVFIRRRKTEYLVG